MPEDSRFCPYCGTAVKAAAVDGDIKKAAKETGGSRISRTGRKEPDELCCPVCYSANIKVGEVGYSAAKGIVGGLLAGGIGLVAGFHGSHKPECTCLKCGYKWKV